MTYVLILANLIAYAVGFYAPLTNSGRILSYGFTHANGLHLTFNMLALLTFGLGVERALGRLAILYLYLSAIVGGALLHVALANGEAVIGASAGVYGLVVAYALLHPERKVMLLVFPMRAITLGYLAFGLELTAIAFGWLPSIAHYAHLGGALTALGLTLILRRSLWPSK